MTLDEVIEMYTNNAEYERTHGNLQGCLDFKQLAKWLKELKAYRQAIENIKSEIREAFEDYDYEENDVSEYQSIGNINDIIALIDKHISGKEEE